MVTSGMIVVAAATLCRASVATTKKEIYYLPNEMQKS
jgi:hypothetical protein